MRCAALRLPWFGRRCGGEVGRVTPGGCGKGDVSWSQDRYQPARNSILAAGSDPKRRVCEIPLSARSPQNLWHFPTAVKVHWCSRLNLAHSVCFQDLTIVFSFRGHHLQATSLRPQSTSVVASCIVKFTVPPTLPPPPPWSAPKHLLSPLPGAPSSALPALHGPRITSHNRTACASQAATARPARRKLPQHGPRRRTARA